MWFSIVFEIICPFASFVNLFFLIFGVTKNLAQSRAEIETRIEFHSLLAYLKNDATPALPINLTLRNTLDTDASIPFVMDNVLAVIVITAFMYQFLRPPALPVVHYRFFPVLSGSHGITSCKSNTHTSMAIFLSALWVHCSRE